MHPDFSEAAVFLTHVWNERIRQHFSRLQRQAPLPVFLFIHNANPQLITAPIIPTAILITLEEGARILPQRLTERERANRRLNQGFIDLIVIPALMHPALAPYRYIWLFEYDVDYSGDWSSFFASRPPSDADLLGTTFYPRELCLSWFHWAWFSPPDVVLPAHYTRSFLPVARFSRRMIDAYVAAITSGQWGGHTEVLYPTIARHRGFGIEDLGGAGPFCPPASRGQFYSNNNDDPNLSPGTFVFRPPRHAYFHEAPHEFAEANHLYHPIKVVEATVEH